MRYRLDQALVSRGLTATRSQAESWIKLGKVLVNGRPQTKPGFLVDDSTVIDLQAEQQYVSRAALKLESVAKILHVNFKEAVVLDVGSSTGGFTDFALRHGARKVIAVEVGTDQLHSSLRGDDRIELHEQTDIRNVVLRGDGSRGALPAPRDDHRGGANEPAGPQIEMPDLVVIDVSFVSLRDILPHVATLCGPKTQIIAMVKPQFEAVSDQLKHKGVIKNDRLRRDILKHFEDWARQQFVIIDKADSKIAGAKGNLERFYKLQKV